MKKFMQFYASTILIRQAAVLKKEEIKMYTLTQHKTIKRPLLSRDSAYINDIDAIFKMKF